MSDPLIGWSTFALAVFSLVAVAISYWGIKRQAESLASSVSADISLKLVDRFEEEKLLKIRASAAAALLENKQLHLADDAFDFFEMLGLYVRRKLLDEEVAHSMFFHWVNLYWHAGKSYIQSSRERSSNLYCDFEFPYNTLLKIEMKQDPKSRDVNPTPADVAAFLKQEMGE